VPQQPVELILLKQWAGYVATPMFLVDPAGMLLYYNDAAADILGHNYEETSEMPLDEWGTIFAPTDSLGRPIPPDELPLAVAISAHTPCHGTFWITGLDGVSRHLAVTAVPIEGQGGANLGGLAIFWPLSRR
jgi:PAS domain-containing protein